ncbi:MAG: bifunctional diaminohydroxyphosphoribosylaminopyrimidine deaminase/5-amino-6-(5-phosphoribosylamino)uracil reductase RibD [Saprospiraceae bacterium]|nr:bifunctional diaminohydroxyphosphoribosylaminopyrimidine deaminase/5-amino-6-(5-phosphoribosylamino)uracil reductase RibD [Saprospiraceae bacterium]
MLTQENLLFLKRCFDVGRLGVSTSPNPSVGSIIVSADGRIIGEGFTSPYGGSHAEVKAVASVKKNDRPLLPTATIYVTLEPCSHFGQTPPCVDLIIREKIAHVVIAFLDPNPLVAGRSVTKLREKGVQVQIYNSNNLLNYKNTEGVEGFQKSINYNNSQLENGKIRTLICFLTNIIKKRPYIILKWAQSADGFIGQPQKRIHITNNFTKKIVHKWRSEVDAIMVGTTTAEVDNPELTNRLYYGKSPIRVVLDKNGRLSPNLKIFDGTVKTLIFTEKNLKKDLEKNENRGGVNNVEYHEIGFDESLLESLLDVLQAQKIGVLFVEGGEKLLSNFIERGLWDEARVFTAKKTLGTGIHAPRLIQSTLYETLQIEEDTLRIFRPA